VPRVPDLQCADCGKAMWRSASSLPDGEARCHPCRRLRPTPKRLQQLTCDQCAKTFTRAQRQRFCSIGCAAQSQTVRADDDQHMRRTRRENAAPGLTKNGRDKLRAKWKRQHKPCAYCGAPGDTIDHVLPLVRGGTNHEGNLVPACRRCNSSKSGKTIIEWRHGVSLGKVRQAPDWIGQAVVKRERKPKPQRQPHPCPICGTPTLRNKYCSESCCTEGARRIMRDRYRARNGLSVDFNKPTSKWPA